MKLHLARKEQEPESQAYRDALLAACEELAVVTHTIDHNGVAHPRPKEG